MCANCVDNLLKIDEDYLRNHPDHIFVFGDNLQRKGLGGAAKLRNLPNTYGFITKKAPNSLDSSFYHPDEYMDIFYDELALLIEEISRQPNKMFLISKLGSGLANRYKIWELVIQPRIKVLFGSLTNVKFLF
jgi:hypothetical protein